MSDKKTNESEVNTLFDMVKQRYGDRLTDEQLEEVRKGVEGAVEAAEALRSVKLANGDEPLSIFVPYRMDG